MKVYMLAADANRYQNLVLKREADGEQLLDWFTGEAIGAAWRPLAVEVFRDRKMNRNLPPSDFPSLHGMVPVFSQRAVEALEDLLRANGEILPLSCSEELYFAYNTTNVVDALDEERSECVRFEDGGIIHIERCDFPKL